MKNKMYKMSAFMAVVIAVIMVFTGCGKNTNIPPVETEPPITVDAEGNEFIFGVEVQDDEQVSEETAEELSDNAPSDEEIANDDNLIEDAQNEGGVVDSIVGAVFGGVKAQAATSYSNSKLVVFRRISPNSSPRTAKITKITIHHYAGVGSAEMVGGLFASPARNASSQYAVDKDARVGQYVDESRRAWTSSNGANDNAAVTIEVSNSSMGGIWPVDDKVLKKTIELCIDICKRNGIPKLTYNNLTTGSLTRHNMFANTNCPGPYLQSKFPYIVSEVNKGLNGTVVRTTKKPVLKKGSKGTWVKKLQKKLNKKGAKLSVDGIFGNLTYKAVRKFQKKNKLKVTGVVRAATWKKLY